ncbi:MAG: cell division protein ZapA [Rhodoferax sp.]
MKQIEVQIMGQSYVLGVPDGGEARIHSAVRRVDQAMCAIREAGKVRARDRIAVLAALNLAFDTPEAASAALTPEQSQRIENLIGRLDEVLNRDDRLF